MNPRTLAAFAGIAAASIAQAAITYDESVDGDLSNDRLNPTNFVLANGINSFTMDVIDSDESFGDRDYMSITLAAGQTLESIILVNTFNTDPEGFDANAFFGMQLGGQITVDPDAPNPADLTGFVIGDTSLIGTNILPDLAGASGPTLGAGTYSYWIQQTGEFNTRITLAFNVVPTPSALAALSLAALTTTRRRR